MLEVPQESERSCRDLSRIAMHKNYRGYKLQEDAAPTNVAEISMDELNKNSENQDLFYPVTHFALRKKKNRCD